MSGRVRDNQDHRAHDRKSLIMKVEDEGSAKSARFDFVLAKA
jgi:hypothetical protein